MVLPQGPWSRQAEWWREVEQLGFDHAWTYDHLTWDPTAGQAWGATVSVLAAAALVTSRIRLGTWVASPNYRHPVPFARELAGLDDLSQGRFVLAVGAGGAGADARVLGGPELTAGQRAGRFEEFVELLDLVLTRPRTSWQGEYYQAVDALTTTPCVQRPRVPFVIAANGPRTLRLVARHGAGWATTGPRVRDRVAGATPAERAELERTWWQGVARLSEQLDEVLAEAGRDPATVDRMLSLDAGPVFSLISIEQFRDAAGRAAELGFTDLVVHRPRPGAGVYDGPAEVLGQVAALLPELHAGGLR